MGLDIYIKFKTPRSENYFLSHPYTYDRLSEADLSNYTKETEWSSNITHNLVEMASHIPVTYGKTQTTLYKVVWRPEELGITTTTQVYRPLLEGIGYMIRNRLDLLQYNPENGWGDYNGFLKFLLNYKQAIEDYPECEIEASR